MTKQVLGVGCMLSFTATYAWDNEGRMTSMQYPTVSAPNQPAPNSFPLQWAYYQYDANGRMGGMTWDNLNGQGPQPFASATYTPAGNC